MSLIVDISKKLGPFHLQASFETEGEVMGLLGASGCGKSMTLKCIAGMISPDAGHIELDGRVLFDAGKRINLPPQRRRVGYLFQHYALFPNFTVAQNIAAGLRRRDRSSRKAQVDRLLRALYLDGMGEKYPRQLSGGQQQRVALARILASEPEALLLDEPFSALDSYLKWQVELELMELLDHFQGPTVFVTHSRDEVSHFCASVCVLDQGRSQPKEPVNALFDAPATLSACLLSGCKNVSRARPAGGTLVECLDWGITLDCARAVPGGLTHVGIRAHFLRPAAEGESNAIPCRVLRVIDNVFSAVVMLATPGGERGFSRLRVELDKDAWAPLAGRDALWLQVAPKDVLLLQDG